MMLGLHCDVATDTRPVNWRYQDGTYIMDGIPVAPFDMVELSNEPRFIGTGAHVYASRLTLFDGQFYGFYIEGPVTDISQDDNPYWIQGEQMGPSDHYVFKYCRFAKPFTVEKVNFTYPVGCTMSAERWSRIGPLEGVTAETTTSTDTFVTPNVADYWTSADISTYVSFNLTPPFSFPEVPETPAEELTPGDLTDPDQEG